jgi:hypothetical protein
MPRLTLAAALSALVFLAACATSTPYQAAARDQSGGYSEQKIEDNRFQVQFAGNSLTDRKTVETYLLYRAAELTKESGFDHFRVVRRDTDAKTRLVGDAPFYDPFYDHFYLSYRYFGPRAAIPVPVTRRASASMIPSGADPRIFASRPGISPLRRFSWAKGQSRMMWPISTRAR